MKWLYTALLSTSLIVGSSPLLGSQDVKKESIILQIDGQKSAALEILKNQGIKAVEVKETPFSLPKVEIIGTEGVINYGEMIRLKAKIDKSNLPEYLTQLKYQWTVFEDGKPKSQWTTLEDGKLKENYIIWPDGTEIFLVSGMKPKKIAVTLDIDCLFEIKQAVRAIDASGKNIDGAKVVTKDGNVITEVITKTEMISLQPLTKEIVVGTGPAPNPNPTPTPNPVPVPPTPNPNPNPAPVPDPVIPSGQFGLGKTAYDLAIKYVLAEERGKSGALAGAYELVADRISMSASKQAAGVALTNEDLKLDVQSIMRAVVEANKTALGASAASWQQWDKFYGDQIYELYKTRKLNVPLDWEQAFRETAVGLKAVK